MPTFFDLQKFAHTGIASPDMTAYDKARALATFGGGETQTLTGIPPLSFKSNGKPLISWSMLGNGQQSGTPTPDTPIMPQGTGERTRNLVRFYQEEMQGSLYGVDVTVKNAEITLNGTVTIGSGHWVEIGYKFGGGTDSTDNVVIPCEPETPYTIATEILDGNSTQVRIIVFGTSNENRTVNIGSSLTTTFSGDINRIFISLGAEGVVFNNLKFRVMFNKGSAPLPYEPYGIKIPISSANTTTPVYLGEVETTRKIKKLVLTGEERYNQISGAAPFQLYLPVNKNPDSATVISNFFKGVSRDAWNQYDYFVSSYISRGSVVFRDIRFSDVDAFVEWIAQQYSAGTPVTVWYVLETPTTGIVNEPLCKIGDYADELHSTDAGVTIPTVKGSNTLTVETELKPSSMTITYKK